LQSDGGCQPASSYAAFVSRADRREWVDIHAWDLRQPLPNIPIPLRAPDPDVVIPLQEIFTTTYERGRYFKVLRYDRSPPGPLNESDAQWAGEKVAGAR
jgi:hypothetical protein